MYDVSFRRDVVEFVIGRPDADASWTCGCRAVEATESTYRIVPCDEHRAEFDETQ